MRREAGTYSISTTAGEPVRAFVPHPLPPEPALELAGDSSDLLSRASSELSKLNVASRLVASPDWFVYGYVRKEAVLTSQIEGTQATLADLLAYEADTQIERPVGDVREVCNYLDALAYARRQLAAPTGIPLSLRLLKEVHKRLMKGARGASKQPGELRTTQNWIGGTRPGNAVFVPPPPDQLPSCLSALEKYLHTKDEMSPLVRAGLAHVQFETIHPFLDGNGRVGRLLIGLLLEHWGLLSSPLLYISLHFKRHRDEYYRRLNEVRNSGDWEGWTRFFLEGVAAVASEATEAAGRLFTRYERDRNDLIESPGTSMVTMRLFHRLPDHPILSVARVVGLLGTTKPTAIKAVGQLVEKGILKEATGRRRDRTFTYQKYLDLLREGTELPLRLP
jgi:Fic family protein